MTFVKFPPQNIGEAIAVFDQDVEIVHDVAHGDDTVEVLTENGLIPSIAKFIKDTNERIDGQLAASSHTLLSDRSSANCHPVSAITGLQDTINGIQAGLVSVNNEVDLKSDLDYVNTQLSNKKDKVSAANRVTTSTTLVTASDNIIDGNGLTIVVPNGTLSNQVLNVTWEFGSAFTLSGAFQTSLGDDNSIIVVSTDKSALLTLVWDSSAAKWSL
jgi:hypothetical protein